MDGNNFITEHKSRYDFDRTVDLLLSLASKDGWSIPAVHDLQQSLAKSGKNVRPVKVIEICKPEYSGQMLELNDERIISVMMPCRISVYQKNDGNVYMALLNAASMAGGLPENIARVMTDASENSFSLVRAVEAEG
jgi:uncharacterized protein (DUF302 family)